ncbi:polysaccharide biosynthesis/export family protein [Synechococcus sp. PCC 6312]|uniref:polysaccharide biosynthesis/export family protein n=1 Tax=Synechococcus sp. (strain ATCC 27167 / PCC 6312) TaxID=195253 RepID=UPI00029F0B57|nr:polysaccharide biosynthesis/export family protein [Synechococcus sp. PCC 6312]AFY59908.1 periplasmic protein involved in polysaccharide export [Synechococcus sp. PCC 6312]
MSVLLKDKVISFLLSLLAIPATGVFVQPSLASNFSKTVGMPLSPGDRLNVQIREGEGFSGIYEVSLDGTLNIPYLQPIRVVGLDIAQVEQILTRSLVQAGLFNPKFVQVSVAIRQWGPILINISGATFEPGQRMINSLSAEAQATDQASSRISGSYPPNRYLTAALQAGGGITPYADLQNVRIIRDGQESVVDLSPIFLGGEITDVPLVAGDQIIVPSQEKFQNDYVRPSQITPPGIAVNLSNLTVPATSNASSNLSSQNNSFAYGIRFSQAIVFANCVGGTQTTNALRYGVLVRTDRLTGKTTYIQRSVESLIRNSTDNENNPFLMPYDSVACYDSTVTNISAVLGFLSNLISPFNLLNNLIRGNSSTTIINP